MNQNHRHHFWKLRLYHSVCFGIGTESFFDTYQSLYEFESDDGEFTFVRYQYGCLIFPQTECPHTFGLHYDSFKGTLALYKANGVEIGVIFSDLKFDQPLYCLVQKAIVHLLSSFSVDESLALTIIRALSKDRNAPAIPMLGYDIQLLCDFFGL